MPDRADLSEEASLYPGPGLRLATLSKSVIPAPAGPPSHLPAGEMLVRLIYAMSHYVTLLKRPLVL